MLALWYLLSYGAALGIQINMGMAVSAYMFFAVLILLSGIPAAYSYWLYRNGI